MSTVDFSGMKETGLLPQGKYSAVVVDNETRAGARGPYYNVTLEITDPDYAGTRVYRVLSFADGALESTFKALRALLGADAVPRATWDIEEHEGDLRDCFCRVLIEHEEYQGETKARVKYILPSGGGKTDAPTPMGAPKKRGGSGSLF